MLDRTVQPIYVDIFILNYCTELVPFCGRAILQLIQIHDCRNELALEVNSIVHNFYSQIEFILNAQVLESFVTIYSTSNDSGRISSQSGLNMPISYESFFNGKLKIRCSASIYDIYWQSTEVSAEEEKIRDIYPHPSNNVIGINYHQPPPNFQLGQKKLNGEIDVRGKV